VYEGVEEFQEAFCLLPVALPVVVENQLSESDYVFRSLTTPILAPQFQPAADQ